MIAITSDYKKPKPLPQFINLLVGLLVGAGVGAGVGVAQYPAPASAPAPAALEKPSLLETLASPEYEAFEANYYRDERLKALAAARAAKDEAIALKVSANKARTDANNYKEVASYARADRILNYEAGEEVILDEPAMVYCSAGLVGQTAFVESTTSDRKGSITHLYDCNSGSLQAGQSVGTAGVHQIAFIFE